ncbi:MAG: cobalamin adenosyltransferase [Massilia sp.]|nr:cobalamin adenosyltransferase [Massilia sp.]
MAHSNQLDLELAQRAAQGAVRHAATLGLRICVAVLDGGGHPLAFLRMPGAPLHSIALSEDKAFTALSFGLPTSVWEGELQRASSALRQGLPLRPRFLMFGGGVPVLAGEGLAGAIGVSGASEQQDEHCAAAGLAAAGLLPDHLTFRAIQ